MPKFKVLIMIIFFGFNSYSEQRTHFQIPLQRCLFTKMTEKFSACDFKQISEQDINTIVDYCEDTAIKPSNVNTSNQDHLVTVILNKVASNCDSIKRFSYLNRDLISRSELDIDQAPTERPIDELSATQSVGEFDPLSEGDYEETDGIL